MATQQRRIQGKSRGTPFICNICMPFSLWLELNFFTSFLFVIQTATARNESNFWKNEYSIRNADLVNNKLKRISPK